MWKRWWVVPSTHTASPAPRTSRQGAGSPRRWRPRVSTLPNHTLLGPFSPCVLFPGPVRASVLGLSSRCASPCARECVFTISFVCVVCCMSVCTCVPVCACTHMYVNVCWSVHKMNTCVFEVSWIQHRILAPVSGVCGRGSAREVYLWLGRSDCPCRSESEPSCMSCTDCWCLGFDPACDCICLCHMSASERVTLC